MMPNYTNAAVANPTTMSISQAFHVLKWASSRELFKQKPVFRSRYSKGHF